MMLMKMEARMLMAAISLQWEASIQMEYLMLMVRVGTRNRYLNTTIVEPMIVPIRLPNQVQLLVTTASTPTTHNSMLITKLTNIRLVVQNLSRLTASSSSSAALSRKGSKMDSRMRQATWMLRVLIRNMADRAERCMFLRTSSSTFMCSLVFLKSNSRVDVIINPGRLVGYMRTLATVAVLTAGSLYASHVHPFEIKGQPVRWMLNNLTFNNPEYELALLKFMLKHQLLTNTGSIDLSDKIIAAGIDIQGDLLEGFKHIGVGGVQIGPISLNPSQQKGHLGILYCKALLKQFDVSNESSSMQVGINLIPDDQVIEFAPYLYDDNISNAVALLFQYPLVKHLDFLTINTTPTQQALSTTPEQHSQLIQQTIRKVKDVIPPPSAAITNPQQNIKLYLQTDQTGQRIPVPQLLPTPVQLLGWPQLVQIIKDN